MSTNFTQNVYNLGHLAGRHCHGAFASILTSGSAGGAQGTATSTTASPSRGATFPSSLLRNAAKTDARATSTGGRRVGGSSSSLRTTIGNLPSYLLTLPPRYRSWWITLVTEDPVHVVIETVLLAFVVYMLLWRRVKGYRRGDREKLTEEERLELLREWRETGRAPLVPPPPPRDASASAAGIAGRIGTGVVVTKIRGSKMTVRLPPGWGGGSGRSRGSSPVAAAAAVAGRARSSSFSCGGGGGSGGGERTKTVLNFATHDFLGVASSDDYSGDADATDPARPSSTATDNAASRWRKTTAIHREVVDRAPSTSVKGAARAALARYGCGSCGPRGFYGTIDAHLDLEDVIADHMRTEGAIMYSDGASAASSTIAAFAKRGDLLVVDEAIYEAISTGVTLSRANVVYFRHNDVEDLRSVLERIRRTDDRLRRRSADQRRFIVVEGLYKNRGTVPPLDEIVKIKAEYCYRLIVDESFSFGTLGPNGKGALDHFGLTPMVDAEIIILSLENSIGSIGGVCVGSEEDVDHQRLSGAGYCFSASAPPFLANAAIASLERIKNNPVLVERVKRNRDVMYQTLLGPVMKGVVPDRLGVVSDSLSAMVFLQLSGRESEVSVEEQICMLDDIRDRCLRHGVALVSTGSHVKGHLQSMPPPGLRLTVSALHTEEEIRKVAQVLRDTAVHIFAK